jgi:hypothetical protein
VAEPFDAADRPSHGRLAGVCIEVVGAEPAVDGGLTQHVLDDDHQRMGDGDQRALGSAAGSQATVLGAQVGAAGV